MTWLFIAFASYILNSFTVLIDRRLLKETIKNPFVYTFYVGVLGLAIFLLAPFGFHLPKAENLFFIFLAGASFVAALLFYYHSLQKKEASKVAPLVGGLNPFFIFFLAWLFLGEKMMPIQIVGFFIVLSGSFLISLEAGEKSNFITSKNLLLAIPAAFFFALTFTVSKYVYLNDSFVNGLIWIRIAAFCSVLLFLFLPDVKRAIIEDFKKPKEKRRAIFLFGQGCGALSFVLLNYAFLLGPIALINALQGVQYFFLFFLILILSRKFPKIFQEKITSKIIWQKVISIALITLGLILVFYK